MQPNYPKAVFVSFTLDNGNAVVINAHAVDSVVTFRDDLHSAIVTFGSKETSGKYYVVRGNPMTIKAMLEKAIIEAG